ncbi:MAG: HNH endonuclease [Candidatus Nanopelagicaceae bacterium]
MSGKEAKRLWRQSIRDAWENKCAYCNRPPIDIKSLTLDHVKPKSKGGQDRTSNCVPACKECNHSKGSEDWIEWYRRQDFYSPSAELRIKNWLQTGILESCIYEQWTAS